MASDKLRFTLPVGANLSMDNTVDTGGAKYPGFAADKDGKAASLDALPTVPLVVPNNMENIHTGTFKASDAWLQAHIKPYADWAQANDALLIITTDEDGFTDSTNGVANVGIDTYFGGATSLHVWPRPDHHAAFRAFQPRQDGAVCHAREPI